ncbi:unnamed protein product [Euphydryas editha]|uniref:CHK kinase-like domain-containing protein n=1 Tax=Euphydryas editha TaxID=104508 RepID=A0AAU9UJ28_EUPED|nr:unnamed protein product [Euphydryas editha]
MSLDVNVSEPDEFNCIELHECIKSVAEIYNINAFTYHVDLVCGKGENYIANVFRVSINETDKNNSVSVIVKTLINTVRQELFRELHKREVNAYKYVIKKFDLLQNILADDERTIVPNCIFSSTAKNNEVIILEDLLLRGFVIENKLKKCENLDYSEVHFILTELAKFHALSFVFQYKEESNFKSLSNEFKDLIFQDKFLNKTKLRNYFQESYLMSLNLIKNIEAKNKLEKVKDKLIEILRMYSEEKKYNVFCHGDCWINNILFKDEADRKQLCFLDFQAMRYASPVTDIMYFLYLCTDSTFRTKYFEDLKLAYYNTLESFLKKFDIEANNMYPKEEFHKDITEMLPYGLLIALIELRIVTTTPDEELNSYDSEVNLNSNEDNKTEPDGKNLYEMRVNDLVDDSVNSGVLDKLLNLAKTC